MYELLIISSIFLSVVVKLFRRRVSWTPILVGFGIAILLSTVLYTVGKQTKIQDEEIWNGKIIGKEIVKVNCSHSYSCDCYPVISIDMNGNPHTDIECETCYRHDYDQNWLLITDIGEIIIDRIDKQGIKTPSMWKLSRVNDSVSNKYTFDNYIKATWKEKEIDKRFSPLIPEYPLRIYDYYKCDRVFSMGFSLPDLDLWNQELPIILKSLGIQKQANVIIIFVNTLDKGYVKALSDSWIGGKKNDIIVVISTTTYPKINWVEVISWTDVTQFKIDLANVVEKIKKIDRQKILELIHYYTMKSFIRKPMADFSYLKSEITISGWMTFIIVVMNMINFGVCTLVDWRK